MADNERLAALLIEAGFLGAAGDGGRKQFARAVTREAKARGSTQEFTHTYVTRWLAGSIPRNLSHRAFIRAALTAKLGRPVAADEIGFPASKRSGAESGLVYPRQVGDGVNAVSQLLSADQSADRSLLTAPIDVASWNDASLSWVVGSTPELAAGGGSGAVGRSDVSRVRSTRDMFDRMDNQFGGGHARRALVEYLRDELPRLLRGGATEEVRRDLFSAAGEATQLTAWMSYDAGLHGLAQRYFIQALGLADMAGDRLLGASVLDAMSHQATFLGRFREAANLARAARLGSATLGVPILASHFYVMEARALARMGDAVGCDRALACAVTEFERRVPGEGPAWIQYFDDAELAAEFGHCNRDLGRAVHASSYASQSLGSASGDYLRSDFFATMVLAHAYMDQGEAEEACRVALTALEIGENLKSARSASYVAEFRQRLERAKGSSVVREFESKAEGARLWTPAATVRQ